MRREAEGISYKIRISTPKGLIRTIFNQMINPNFLVDSYRKHCHHDGNHAHELDKDVE